METSMQRLSTGKRINSSHDDAAGQQIASRLTAEIQGLKMSIRNAADGQAMLGTAEGALNEVTNILLRLREMAVQSANDTNGTADRAGLQSEADALELEIQRISDNTTWAGLGLLDGTWSGAAVDFEIHVGPDASQNIGHSIPAMAVTAATIAMSAADVMTSVTTASSYITTMDNALSAVNTEREQIGAVMNRLDYTIANLANVVTNLQVSKGRIEDADFATETANLARTQVLQQASMAMLAQANAAKQNILTLFQ